MIFSIYSVSKGVEVEVEDEVWYKLHYKHIFIKAVASVKIPFWMIPSKKYFFHTITISLINIWFHSVVIHLFNFHFFFVRMIVVQIDFLFWKFLFILLFFFHLKMYHLFGNSSNKRKMKEDCCMHSQCGLLSHHRKIRHNRNFLCK